MLAMLHNPNPVPQQHETIKVSDTIENELIIQVAPCLNIIFAIRGGVGVEFEAMMKCDENKYPFVPKQFYLKPLLIRDECRRGSVGDAKPYNLDHFIPLPTTKATTVTRLFGRRKITKKKRKREENDGLTHHPPPSPGTRKYWTILAQNAGYWIIANLILQRKWEDLNLLFTNFLPESIESINKKPEWGNVIAPTVKHQCVIKIHDFLNTIFLHIHDLAPRVWNGVKHCPNMSQPQLWQSLQKDGSESRWFRYECYLRQYAVEFGYFNGEKLNMFDIMLFCENIFFVGFQFSIFCCCLLFCVVNPERNRVARVIHTQHAKTKLHIEKRIQSTNVYFHVSQSINLLQDFDQ